ncbi:hypothetical protein WJX74_003434 [Apatococcus lobatus]|uniref:Uncharacterized protein n=1 Tax=Apatococcus lobatus TaxID=904363 RepID=A0AAW1QLW0_9CHLO
MFPNLTTEPVEQFALIVGWDITRPSGELPVEAAHRVLALDSFKNELGRLKENSERQLHLQKLLINVVIALRASFYDKTDTPSVSDSLGSQLFAALRKDFVKKPPKDKKRLRDSGSSDSPSPLVAANPSFWLPQALSVMYELGEPHPEAEHSGHILQVVEDAPNSKKVRCNLCSTIQSGANLTALVSALREHAFAKCHLMAWHGVLVGSLVTMVHVNTQIPETVSMCDLDAPLSHTPSSSEGVSSRKESLVNWSRSIRIITGKVKKILPPAKKDVEGPGDASMPALDQTPNKLAAAVRSNEHSHEEMGIFAEYPSPSDHPGAAGSDQRV